MGTTTADIGIDSEKSVHTLLLKGLNLKSHYPAGPIYANLRKQLATLCLQAGNELEGVYHLVESHFPTLRVRTSHRYDSSRALIDNDDETPISFNKDFVTFECNIENPVDCLLSKIAEMPKEWTIVQITTQYDIKDSLLTYEEIKYRTTPIHVTVFNCGQKDVKPFCITVSEPKNKNGPLEICTEMQELIKKNISLYPQDNSDKKVFWKYRQEIDESLKNIVYVIEKKWLKEWRILLLGKLINFEAIYKRIREKLEQIITKENFKLDERSLNLLCHLTSGSSYLTNHELLTAIKYCIPSNPQLSNSLIKEISELSFTFNTLFKGERHPVILIVDQRLDCFPWEVCSVLKEHPVSRLPSVHFVYGLFKEHQSSIINGFKTNINEKNGNYIVNPGQNLTKMEKRMESFYKYWLPKWNGIVGITPDSDEYKNLLVNCDIFAYSGHGSGTQYLKGDEIQKLRVNGVVFLFGCSSVALTSLGGRTELTGTHDQYLIACSPCVVGNLWQVTDYDTDILSTTLLSYWLPSNVKYHWKYIEKKNWKLGKFATDKISAINVKSCQELHEPELLRTICLARKATMQFWTSAAIVARGLPVKLGCLT